MRGGIILTGPTGVGKTHCSIQLADHLASQGRPVDIVSADALSIYRELEIGTAKPSRESRARVRHHFVDIRSIADTRGVRPAYSAGEFARDFFALQPFLPDPPIIAGGTAFYIDAITRGLAETPPADDEIRGRLLADETARPGSTYDRLAELDRPSAERIGRENLQRLIRALEVCEITGAKFSDSVRKPPSFKPVVFVLEMNRADLYRAIDERTRRMFETGLLDEVEHLLSRFPPSLPSLASIGYAEAVLVVRGAMSRDDAVARAARRSRQLAKRQLTWWRHFRYERMCFVPSSVLPAGILSKWKELESCGVS